MKLRTRIRVLAVLALLAAGCLGGPSMGRAQAKTFTIGVSLASDVIPFYIAMAQGMREQAKAMSARLRFVTANEDMAAQLNGVQDLIAAGVDLILISPIDAVASGAAYDAAARANIPIMSIARGAKTTKQAAFIRMNEEGVGEDIGRWVVKKTGGKARIAMLTGPAGASFTRAMVAGFKRVIKKYAGIEVLTELHSPLARESGLKLAEDVLTTHQRLDVIYCANDDIALGAAQAVQAARRTNVLVTGLDGVPPAIEAVRQGRMALTVVLNPAEWGKLGVKTAVQYLNGAKPPSDVYVKHLLVDARNVHTMPRLKRE